MLIAQYVTTKHDVNGNPRRGWTVYTVDKDASGREVLRYVRFVDEGYAGNNALRQELSNAGYAPADETLSTWSWILKHVTLLPALEVTVTQFNTLKRDRAQAPRGRHA